MIHKKRSGPTGAKSAAVRAAAFILLQAICMGPAHPQDGAKPKFKEEFVKQEKIYRSRGASVPGGYVTNRSLSSYIELLPSGFWDALRKLGPGGRWLDIGAGGGQAILDYYSPDFDTGGDGKRAATGNRARAVAISIEDRRSEQWKQRAASLGPDSIQYFYSKRLRDYSALELGKFNIITDVYGGFSYTDELSLFLDKVLSVLETGGSFFTMIQSVHLEDGKDPPTTWYLTELIDSAGRDVKVCAWLKSVSCVKVTCESRGAWEAPTELIHVQKVCNEVSVPPLKPLQYEAGNPPERRFQVRR